MPDTIRREHHKSESKRITIDPITRLEGPRQDRDLPERRRERRQRLLAGAGAAWLRDVLHRSVGRRAEQDHLPSVRRMPRSAPPVLHQGPGRGVQGHAPARRPIKLRELFYAAHYVHSHIAHFYALAAADFVLGPCAPAANEEHPRRGRRGRRAGRCRGHQAPLLRPEDPGDAWVARPRTRCAVIPGGMSKPSSPRTSARRSRPCAKSMRGVRQVHPAGLRRRGAEEQGLPRPSSPTRTSTTRRPTTWAPSTRTTRSTSTMERRR